jgi:hypothetical protein
VLTAQEPTPDYPLEFPISYNNPVGDTITELALFDWWVLTLKEGDTIRVEMQGSEGLAPLIGILDGNRDIIARSDDTVRGEPNGMVTLQFRSPYDGEFRIVATRDGNADGTTTGAYTLFVTLESEIPERENNLPEVTFRCGEMLVTNALSVYFSEDVQPKSNAAPTDPAELYALSVAGYETFTPVIRANASVSENVLDCTRDARTMPDSRFVLPNLPSLQITDEDHAARLILQSLSMDTLLGSVTYTVGSLDGTTGTFVTVLQGLSLDDRDAPDLVYFRLGPRAKDSTITIYMISDKDTRLDPVMTASALDGTQLATCDDAGSRLCPDVPSAQGLTVYIAEADGATITGGRFDAGLVLQPNTTDAIALSLESKNGDTSGGYTLVFVTELK